MTNGVGATKKAMSSKPSRANTANSGAVQDWEPSYWNTCTYIHTYTHTQTNMIYIIYTHTQREGGREGVRETQDIPIPCQSLRS